MSGLLKSLSGYFNPEKEHLGRIRTNCREFRTTVSVSKAVECLDKIMLSEKMLEEKAGYLASEIGALDFGLRTAGIALRSGSSSSNAVYYIPEDLPDDTKKYLLDTGYYGYIKEHISNVFVVKNTTEYSGIFPRGKAQLGAAEPVTRSVAVLEPCPPLLLAAALVHEATHIKTYSKFNMRSMGEKAAEKAELEFWEKAKAIIKNPTKTESILIEGYMADLKKRVI